MERKRVLHLIDTGGPGGAETIFLKLVLGLDREQWDSIAVVPWKDWLSETLESHGIGPIILPSRSSFDVAYLRGIVELARRHRVDLIQTHLLTTAVYANLAARFLGLPVVSTFHGTNDVSPTDRLKRVKFRIIDRRASQAVFVSNSLRRAFQDFARLNRVKSHVVHNGIDTQLFRPAPDRSFRRELGVRDDEILVGAIGNIRISKAYPVLLQAAAELSGSKRCRFVIVGRGDDSLHEDLLRQRKELGLERDVILAGFREDVPRVMNNLDVYVLSSSAEGFSLTTVQAMACGVPVVATKCGGPEEIVNDVENGLLVAPNDPGALARAIETLVGDAGLRARLGAAGRALVERRFALRSMVNGYESIYRAATSTGKPIATVSEPNSAAAALRG